MNPRNAPFGLLLAISLLAGLARVRASDAAPGEPPATGKTPHVVFITGDDEYRSEESMPMLAKIVQRDYGFRVTICFSVDEQGFVSPESKSSITDNVSELADADLMVLFTRWRTYPPEKLKFILDYAESGKPILGFRTAHHGFQYGGGRNDDKVAGWKEQYGVGTLGDMNGPWLTRVFGQIFEGHNGPNTVTRVTPVEENKDHPILRGVRPFTARSWLYRIKPFKEEPTLLLRGQSLDSNYGRNPDPPPVKDPQPVAWLRSYKTHTGKRTPVFFTSLGHPEDFKDENMRRLSINAMLYLLGRKVPTDGAKSDPVGEYVPPLAGEHKAPEKKYKPQDLWPGAAAKD